MERKMAVLLIAFFVVAGICAGFSMQVTAAEFPSRNITWIVGSAPGGGNDIYARAIGRYMEKYLPKGINVIVENRVGAGHKIAGAAVFNAKPDGYTIGTPAMPGLQIASILGTFDFDVSKLTWLSTIEVEPRVLMVSPKSKYRTLKDLQAAELVTFALTSFEDIPDSPIVNETLGIKAKYITGHKGSSDMSLALKRGDADATQFSYGSARKDILNKEVIPILVCGTETRVPEIPDIPTLGELGHPDVNVTVGTWRLVVGPPGMPADIKNKLADIIWQALNDKEFLEWSKKSNRSISPLKGDATEKLMKQVVAGYSSDGNCMTILKRYMK